MIFLAQTDTTAGLLSKDFRELNRVKGRAPSQPCVLTTARFSELSRFVRVPVKFKNLVRRARKTTILYPVGAAAFRTAAINLTSCGTKNDASNHTSNSTASDIKNSVLNSAVNSIVRGDKNSVSNAAVNLAADLGSHSAENSASNSGSQYSKNYASNSNLYSAENSTLNSAETNSLDLSQNSTLRAAAIRVVKDCAHEALLAEFGAMYSTSANRHGCGFDEEWAREVADVVADDEFFESTPSKILKISKTKVKKIR